MFYLYVLSASVISHNATSAGFCHQVVARGIIWLRVVCLISISSLCLGEINVKEHVDCQRPHSFAHCCIFVHCQRIKILCSENANSVLEILKFFTQHAQK